MPVGVAMFCTDDAMPPKALAMALEERGFASLWLPEYSHISLSRLLPVGRGVAETRCVGSAPVSGRRLAESEDGQRPGRPLNY